MSRRRRTALSALAVAVALALPAPLAFAQGEPPHDDGAPAAQADDPAPPDDWPPYPRAADAPPEPPDVGAPPPGAWPPYPRAEDAADEAAAIAQEQPPDEPATPPQRPEDALTGPPALAQAQPDDDVAAAERAPHDASAASSTQAPAPGRVARRLAEWIAATGDNGGLPFLIVDKLGAAVFAFGADGALLGSAPALVGLARGDDSAPGIGDLKLSQIPDDQRTTPAGRFVARFGDSDGHGKMLWVDLPDAISLHPVMSVNAGENRFQRIKSSDPEQHRISYGCINVPKAFYDGVVLPALGGGAAVVYVLPDTKPIREVFPAFAAAVGDEQAKALREPSDAPAPLQRLD